jgi:tetratricopeptide (TPR) repeat protein
LAIGLTRLRPPRHDEAVGYFRAAAALRPHSPLIHVWLGNAFRCQGKLDEALGQYAEALRLQWDNAEAHHQRGVALTHFAHHAT